MRMSGSNGSSLKIYWLLSAVFLLALVFKLFLVDWLLFSKLLVLICSVLLIFSLIFIGYIHKSRIILIVNIALVAAIILLIASAFNIQQQNNFIISTAFVLIICLIVIINRAWNSAWKDIEELAELPSFVAVATFETGKAITISAINSMNKKSKISCVCAKKSSTKINNDIKTTKHNSLCGINSTIEDKKIRVDHGYDTFQHENISSKRLLSSNKCETYELNSGVINLNTSKKSLNKQNTLNEISGSLSESIAFRELYENSLKEKKVKLIADIPDFILEKENISTVLQYAKYIEFILETKYGANGRGLHGKISSIETILDSDTRTTLRKIATIRNRAAHEYTYKIDNIDDYESDCRKVIRCLK